MRRVLITVAIVVGLIIALPLGELSYERWSLRPALPPLLKGARSASGWVGACPPHNEREAAWQSRVALSPELNQRLDEQFPTGSSENALVQSLISQGFTIFHRPCDNDAAILHANFQQRGGGLFYYPMTANVFWKADGGKVVWTKGFVAFSGL